MLAWALIKDAFIGDATLMQSLVFKTIAASIKLSLNQNFPF